MPLIMEFSLLALFLELGALVLVFSFSVLVTSLAFIVEHVAVFMVRLLLLQAFVPLVSDLILRFCDWSWTGQLSAASFVGFVAKNVEVYLVLVQIVVMTLLDIIIDGAAKVSQIIIAVERISSHHFGLSFSALIYTAVRSRTVYSRAERN